jgi:uncharacterized protein YkwD
MKKTRKHARHLGHRVLSVSGVVATSVFAIALLLYCAYYTQKYVQSGQMAAVVTSTLVNLANEDRSSANLQQLTVSPVLTLAAQAKADDEASKGYFAHNSPDGKSSWYWFKQEGYTFTYAGENLAVDFNDSDAVENAWMNSPTHRANIMNAHFTEIGIATAVGTYEGHQTVFVVQMFGTPTTAPTGKVVAINNPTSAKEIAVAKSDVLGAAVVTKKPETAKPVAAATVSTTPKTVTASPPPELIARAEASPQTTLRFVYLALGALILLAMLSVTGFEFKRHHTRHAFAGAFLIVLLVGLYVGANAFVFSKPVVAVASATQSS